MIDPARIETRLDDDVPVIALVGEFDPGTREQLQEQLRALRDTNCKRVVVDLSATRFLDSTTIAALARAHRDGFDITVRGATGAAYRALEVSGLTAMLNAE
jgi:anti-anti-sigma factor